MNRESGGTYRFLPWKIYVALAVIPVLFFVGTRTGWWTSNAAQTLRTGDIVLPFAIPMIVLAVLAWRKQRNSSSR